MLKAQLLLRQSQLVIILLVFVCMLVFVTGAAIVDVNLTDNIFDQLQLQLPGELERHGIVITGICTQCVNSTSLL